MVPWIGPQGIDKVGQKFENAPPLWRPPQRTTNPKLKKIISTETRRLPESIEVWTALYSSFAAGDLCPEKCRSS